MFKIIKYYDISKRMGKRRITRKQSARIDQLQQGHRDKAKTALGTEPSINDSDLGPEQEGTILSFYGSQADVEGVSGHGQRCHIRQNLGSLVAGDKVIWRNSTKHHGIVIARCPRKTILGRPNKQGQIRPVAANVDQMLVVAAPKPQISLSLLDSYLVAAETLHIDPIIVINKADLLSPSLAKQMQHDLQPYKDMGYQILLTNAHELKSLRQLQQSLSEKTSVFVGQSGVGKSSLIAAILPHESIAVGDISSSSELGRHTTSNSRLYHIPQGGHLIDSPGIREFGLWHMSQAEIACGFIEFRPFIGHCKFSDCSHQHEPGCALLAAIAEGKISRQRLASYLKLCEIN